LLLPPFFSFFHTENTFRPERIEAIAERFDLRPDDVLSNILVARAYTSEHQVCSSRLNSWFDVRATVRLVIWPTAQHDSFFLHRYRPGVQIDLTTQLAKYMREAPFALLVVDSATALFRVDFCGRGELSERQMKLGKFLAALKRISEEFNVAVWITNQVMVCGPMHSSVPVQSCKQILLLGATCAGPSPACSTILRTGLTFVCPAFSGHSGLFGHVCGRSKEAHWRARSCACKHNKN